jgi:D-alanine-D-alanine ligase
VLAGGLSHERDVSLRSGRRAAGALRASGFHVEESDVDGFLLSKMGQSRPSCVLPMLHGETGEDGSIQEVLQLLDLAYVGSHPAACRVAFDKPVAKTTVARVGVQTPEAVCLPHGTFRELGAQVVLAALVDRLGLPMMIKPTKGGSALGASLVRDVGQLPTAMVNAFAYGETVMIERFVVGTEVAVLYPQWLSRLTLISMTTRPDTPQDRQSLSHRHSSQQRSWRSVPESPYSLTTFSGFALFRELT